MSTQEQVVDTMVGELKRELAIYEALVRANQDGPGILKQGRKVTLIAETVEQIDPNGRNYKG